jgi:sucrose synthase
VFEAASEFLSRHRDIANRLVGAFQTRGKPLLLQSELFDLVEQFCHTEHGDVFIGSPPYDLLRASQEAVVDKRAVFFSVRWSVGRWSYVRLSSDRLELQTTSATDFLAAKERVVHDDGRDQPQLEIDLSPFERGFPRLREIRSIGQGVDYLNRYLSSRLFQEIDNGGQRLYQFLRMHQARGVTLMLNDRIGDLEQLRGALRIADAFLARQSPERPWSDIAAQLVEMGFEPGWGRTVGRARETMGFLSDILEAPAPDCIARFLGRLPMIFTIAIISPHGYFGQADVLGKPDTGGQVVYILDQVRALERAMLDFLYKQGLDIAPRILVVTRLIPEAEGTTCNQRVERIEGTREALILRVPFREPDGDVVPHWISRFHVWPYLERFAGEATQAFREEAGQDPDFIIGNYSDGNLVAAIMAHELRVTQCNIAHALEKTKYLYSDLYWKEHEGSHNFACQYTADLIAINTADFIVTSTYQEIAGTADSIGQYESYQAYTLPNLYRVVYGVDVFDPKFNIVSPGADPQVFFPYSQQAQRDPAIREHVRRLVHDPDRSDALGDFRDGDKPLLFAMSRLDFVKNPAGLVEWFGQHETLRDYANLLLVGGSLDVAHSNDAEEREQIERLHGLMDRYHLDDHVRWVVMQADKRVVGELYRHAADRRGAFVQPALFEAFGLTVIEAMSSGLPCFATQYGGPLETIEDGVSGFHIDPNQGEQAAARMLDFFIRCNQEDGYWETISLGALQRVASHYTWELYAERLLRLARIYGFWKYFSNIEREEIRRYLEMLYFLAYRPMAAEVAARNRGK